MKPLRKSDQENKNEVLNDIVDRIDDESIKLSAALSNYIDFQDVKTAGALLTRLKEIGTLATNGVFIMTACDEPEDD